MDWVVIVVAILGGSGIGSVIGAIASWHAASRKLKSEIDLKQAQAEKTIGDTWRDFANPLIERVNNLTSRIDVLQEEREGMRVNHEKRIQNIVEEYEKRVKHLEAEVNKLRVEVGRLRKFIGEHGLDPGVGD
jgi:gas vesicle protein